MAVFLLIGCVWGWFSLVRELETAQVLNLYFLFSLSDSWLLFSFVTYKNVRLQGHFLGFCPSNPPPGVTLLSGNSVACSGGFTLPSGFTRKIILLC